MSLTNIMGLLGGLALFLYGMQMMSQGLENAAGNKMQQILEKLTANRFLGVLVGALITAVIQSSSATTVMVVGFVNAGMMTLNQAVWIIMGANIGTTITGQLIALDAGAVAPIIAFIGVILIIFSKKEKIGYVGSILAGLGILFIGMDMMGGSMEPLAQSQSFISLLTKFSNPILGILAGTIFTAIIQSSSASVGILQALAGSGIVTLDSAAFILFGQNIGTCITAFLAALGANRNAKRTTIIHITFNVIGTIIFTILCITTPLIPVLQGMTESAPKQIANLHTMFNVTTTLILLPFGTALTKLAQHILPDPRTGEPVQGQIGHLQTKNSDVLGMASITLEETKRKLEDMLFLAEQNVHSSYDVFLQCDRNVFQQIEKREEQVDELNKDISKFITMAFPHENTKLGSQVLNSCYTISSNIERISDHAMNIAEYYKMNERMGLIYTEEERKEVCHLQKTCDELFEKLKHPQSDLVQWHSRIAALEQKIDDITGLYRSHMFERMKNSQCSFEGNLLLSEMLTDFERIGDHALNIADELLHVLS